jgi:hypothetical protein
MPFCCPSPARSRRGCGLNESLPRVVRRRQGPPQRLWSNRLKRLFQPVPMDGRLFTAAQERVKRILHPRLSLASDQEVMETRELKRIRLPRHYVLGPQQTRTSEMRRNMAPFSSSEFAIRNMNSRWAYHKYEICDGIRLKNVILRFSIYQFRQKSGIGIFRIEFRDDPWAHLERISWPISSLIFCRGIFRCGFLHTKYSY